MHFQSLFYDVLEYLFTAMCSVMGGISSLENAKQLTAIFSRLSKMSSKFAKLDS